MIHKFEDRREEFLKKYQALTEELKCDYIQIPMFVPDAQQPGKPQTFRLIVQNHLVDLDSAPVPSPFMAGTGDQSTPDVKTS